MGGDETSFVSLMHDKNVHIREMQGKICHAKEKEGL